MIDTPERVFLWRERERSYFSALVSVVIVSAAFLFLLGLIRIQVVMPKPITPHKASVIYLTGDQVGHALALKAQEGGPFPSRFIPSQWKGMADLEAQAMEATRRADVSYIPKLRELPTDKSAPPVILATQGVPVFPKHLQSEYSPPDAAPLRLVPMLYPLSGIAPEAIPEKLPAYQGDTASVITSADWRFLMRLNPDGGVAECVSLEKGGENGSTALEKWLRQIRFQTTSTKPFRWVAVGIGFVNQPIDGNHTH
jgi:hypothetical protein